MYRKIFTWHFVLYIGFLMGLLFPITACQAGENESIPTLSQITQVDIRAEVIADNANLRQGPGVEYGLSGTLNKGDIVSIDGMVASGEWYRLTTGDWITAGFIAPFDPLQVTETPFSTQSAPTEVPETTLPAGIKTPTIIVEQQPMCEILVSSANLRADPGREFPVISYLYQGESIPVQAITKRADGSDWYFVKLENGTLGWVIDVVCAPIDGMVLANVPVVSRPVATDVVPLSTPVLVPATQPPTPAPIIKPTATICITRNCGLPTLVPMITPTSTRCVQRNCG